MTRWIAALLLPLAEFLLPFAALAGCRGPGGSAAAAAPAPAGGARILVAPVSANYRDGLERLARSD